MRVHVFALASVQNLQMQWSATTNVIEDLTSYTDNK